jgi:hypothetical protein
MKSSLAARSWLVQRAAPFLNIAGAVFLVPMRKESLAVAK